jgi:hypothetical protein
VDVSPAVIELARRETIDEKNVEYRVFNVLETECASDLHLELGDLDVYVRGVLHMIKRSERPLFVQTLEILLGEKGTLYEIELPLAAFAYWRTLPDDFWSMVPKVTRRAGFGLEDIPRCFPADGWVVIEQGQDAAIHTIPLSDGREADVPANYFILRRRIL